MHYTRYLYATIAIHIVSNMAGVETQHVTDQIKVEIAQGTLIGAEARTKAGFRYYEFFKIPYGEPPVGELRFKSPMPPRPWTGERNATYMDSNDVCYQHDISSNLPKGSEDCLYLSVYTPVLPTHCSLERLPVMVYIHGGGFVLGSGTDKSSEGPDFFVEKGVIIVVLNYRLNIFGFLNLNTSKAAGNMGLKDQVMALKWVQNNINAFGGDKDRVTIFGISAGSASVEYHVLSPMSKGLFHRGIMHSGSTINPWATNYNPRDIVIKVAEKLGFDQSTINSESKLHESLMELSTSAVGQAAFDVISETPQRSFYFGFVPSVEQDFGTGDSFLTENPYVLLQEGRFNKVQLIKGFCEFEGLVQVHFNPQSIERFEVEKNFTDYCKYFVKPKDIDDCNNKFFDIYYQEDIGEHDKQQFAIDLIGDFDVTSGTWIGSELMAKHNVPIHCYMFSYDGNLNFMKITFDIRKKGACHADDASYIMLNHFQVPIHINVTDILTSKRMVEMWSNFAKTGDPTPALTGVVNISWPRFTTTKQRYLKINNELSIESDYKPRRISYFRHIYTELYSSPNVTSIL